MRKRFAAAFSIAFAITPASAVDLGVSVNGGGIDVGGVVSVDRDGASIGLGAGVGGAGQVDAGASVGTDQGGASVGVSGKVDSVGQVDAGASVGTDQGGASVGVSGKVDSVGQVDAGASVGTGDSSVGASVGMGTGGAGTSGDTTKGASSMGATIGSTAGKTSKQSAATSQSSRPAKRTAVPPKGDRKPLVLPPILLPRGGSDRASTLVESIPGTPNAVVRTCRRAVETAAGPYGAISVSAKSSGSMSRLNGGLVSAPIYVRIKYMRQGGLEVREARIRCKLDTAGKVVRLT